jgi:exosortase A-associated hydrolase 1
MERPLIFECAGEQLVGVISMPSGDSRLGILVLVGGPQYRVGSHRQFLLLARRLAAAGLPTMRFDYRGMGDSSGASPGFEQTVPDIQAAIEAFKAACPSLEQIVLWGLCDAASAALLYLRVTRDPCAVGLILLNPWVRSEQSLAITHVKHYYRRRVLEREFWAKLAGGRINIGETLRELAGNVFASLSPGTDRTSTGERGFQDRMATALTEFSGPVLLILSGRDYTAREFVEYAHSNARWSALMSRSNVERIDLPQADHTFSTAAWRQEVEALTLQWLVRWFRAEAR